MKKSILKKFICVAIIVLLALTQMDLAFNRVEADSTVNNRNILLWSKDSQNYTYYNIIETFTNNTITVYNQIYNSQVTIDDLTKSSSTLPNLDKYSLVFIILPNTMPNSTEIQNLKEYVAKGGRIVLIGEHNQVAGAQNTILSNIAAQLGAHFEIKDGVYGRIKYSISKKSRFKTIFINS